MIGLDIGTRSIKISEVVYRGDGLHILTALMADLPDAPGGSKFDAALVARLKSLLKDSGFTTKAAASSVCGCQVLARNFTFPQLPQRELAGAVKLESEQSISLDLSTMYTDFQTLAPLDGGNLDVLFVAVPKPMVDRSAGIIENAGLDLEYMDIDNLALANAYMSFEPDFDRESVILMDIGHTLTSIAVFDGGVLRFVRNVGFGGRDISAEIARFYGVGEDVAEQIKKQPALWPEIGLNIRNILRRSMPELLEAVYRTIEYCMSRKKLVNVDRVLLTGGSSYLSGIDGFLAEALGVNTGKWNPLAKAAVKGAARRELGQFLSISLGLAVRRE